MKNVNKLIKIAIGELGYLEKASTDVLQINDKKANAGTANYTKYARDLDMVCFYTSTKQGYAWCKVFVDWCLWVLTEQGIEALRMQHIYGTYYGTASCTETRNYFRNANSYGNKPEIGSLIFFTQDNGRTCTHVGIVVDIYLNTVYTIEGNTSDKAELVTNGGAVVKKSYPLNYSKIDGYGYLDWSQCAEDEEDEDEMDVYEHLPDVPKSYQATIRKLMEKGALGGYSDPDKSSLDDNVIKVSEDFCRIMTVLDKLGVLDGGCQCPVVKQLQEK